MTKVEINYLQELLLKLRKELNARYCIVPEYIQDLVYLATYDQDGNIQHQTQGVDLADAIEKIKK